MNVTPGQEIPELVKHPQTSDLVRYAGASGDFYEIHYDRDYAQSLGLPGVILHGLLKTAYLGQLVTDWLGEAGRLRSLDVSYRGMDFPGRAYRCRGIVKEKDRRLVTLEVWGEDPDGKRTTIGTAVVELNQEG